MGTPTAKCVVLLCIVSVGGRRKDALDDFFWTRRQLLLKGFWCLKRITRMSLDVVVTVVVGQQERFNIMLKKLEF